MVVEFFSFRNLTLLVLKVLLAFSFCVVMVENGPAAVGVTFGVAPITDVRVMLPQLDFVSFDLASHTTHYCISLSASHLLFYR